MQEYSPISPRVIKVDYKNLNIERRKRYEEGVRQWWMKREREERGDRYTQGVGGKRQRMGHTGLKTGRGGSVIGAQDVR